MESILSQLAPLEEKNNTPTTKFSLSKLLKPVNGSILYITITYIYLLLFIATFLFLQAFGSPDFSMKDIYGGGLFGFLPPIILVYFIHRRFIWWELLILSLLGVLALGDDISFFILSVEVWIGLIMIYIGILVVRGVLNLHPQVKYYSLATLLIPIFLVTNAIIGFNNTFGSVKSIDDCGNALYSEQKGKCIFHVAINSKDPILCLKSGYFGNLCLEKTRTYLTPSICEKFAKEGYGSLCYKLLNNDIKLVE